MGTMDSSMGIKTALKSFGTFGSEKERQTIENKTSTNPYYNHTTKNLLRIKHLFLFAGYPANHIPKILL